MHAPGTRFLRNCAATLVTISGLSLIAALWLRELTGPALLDAFIGSVYLFIAIGLYGRSRFTLFVAMAACGASLVWLSNREDVASAPVQLRMLADLMAILCCGWVLWQVRNDPSV